jgi:hypothetical protein
MKYKILKSIAHNFSHSFLSWGSAVEPLLKLARDANGERVSIQWIPEAPNERRWPPRTTECIAIFRKWLPKHIAASGGEVERIREFRTDIFLNRKKQMAAEAYILDDRGKEHVCNVLF